MYNVTGNVNNLKENQKKNYSYEIEIHKMKNFMGR